MANIDSLISLKSKRDSELDVTNFHSYDDGWYSTSKKTPLQGLIFKPIKDVVIVEYKDNGTQIGIVDSIELITNHTIGGNKLAISVMDENGNLFATNKFKIIQGVLKYGAMLTL
jgi:hypothetical protein